MDKKGAAPRYITILIMAFLGLVIIAASLIFFVGPAILTGADRSTCQQWVDLNAKKIAGIQTISFIPGHADSPCYTTKDKINPKEENQVYAEVAKQMYSCFTQYRGQDERDFYSDWGGWDHTNVYCRVCSDIEFKDDFEFDGSNFGKYLATHSIPALEGRQADPKTYMELFSSTENSRDIDFDKDLGTISLKDGSSLYTFYAITKGRGFDPLKSALIIATPTVAGAGTGFIWGAGIFSVPTSIAGTVIGFGIGVTSAVGEYKFHKTEPAINVLVGDKEDVEEYCGEEIYYKTRHNLLAGLNPLKGDDDA